MFELASPPRRGCPVYPLPDPPPSFGLLLRRYRERAGLSCNALARQVGMDQSYVSRLERGERAAAHRTIVLRLAAVLDLDAVDTERLLILGGHCPEWLMALAEQARISPREAVG